MSISQYILKDRIGIGSYGMVFKAQRKDDKKTFFVIKQIPFYTNENKENIEEAKNEAKILKQLDCKYIVKYYDSFEENNTLNIVMEYCQNGDLSTFINENKTKNILLSENQIWKFFIEMSLGLAYIHYRKILHRDLKTLNIFLTKDLDVKIGDLGVAKILQNTIHAHTFIGTPYYLSPEICEEKPYNEKSDVWALGCILYELITFKKPYNAKNQAALFFKITNGNYEPIPNHLKYSKELKKMVDLLLEKNYNHRPFMKNIIENAIFVEKAKMLNLYDDLIIILSLYGSQKMNEKNSKAKKIQKITYVKPEKKKSGNVKILSIKNKNNDMYKSENNIANNYKLNLYNSNFNSNINQSEEFNTNNVVNEQVKQLQNNKEKKKERKKNPSIEKFYLSNNLSSEKLNVENKNTNYKTRHSEIIKKKYSSNNNLRYINKSPEIILDNNNNNHKENNNNINNIKKHSFVQNNNVKKKEIKHSTTSNNVNKINTPQSANPNSKVRIHSSRSKTNKINNNTNYIINNNNIKSNLNKHNNGVELMLNKIIPETNNNVQTPKYVKISKNNININSSINNQIDSKNKNVKDHYFINNNITIKNKKTGNYKNNDESRESEINKSNEKNKNSKINKNIVKKRKRDKINKSNGNNKSNDNNKSTEEINKSNDNNKSKEEINKSIDNIRNNEKINKSNDNNKSKEEINKSREGTYKSNDNNKSRDKNLKRFLNKSNDKSISNDLNISNLSNEKNNFGLKIKNINPNNLINDFISELNKRLENTNKILKKNVDNLIATEDTKYDSIPLFPNKNEEEEISFIIESGKEKNFDNVNEISLIEEETIKKKNEFNNLKNTNIDDSDSNSNISNDEEKVSILPNKYNKNSNEENKKQLISLSQKWEEKYNFFYKEFWSYDQQINCKKVLEIYQEAEKSNDIDLQIKKKLEKYIKEHLIDEKKVSKFIKIFKQFIDYEIKLKYVQNELEHI